ncbi:RsmB/NOP family class I SAM-dependent RNA methyltransferase [Permianibacter aggregans]|uniref:16S rRNA (Cytosine967-C5)-methyltransferase n=1 Tax=Permianibacter aggregans TaxID=1510150 RepID=A0A4R6UWF9_9GAMM|nr:RsmB/NOP family class I SAM-dependent RNA methyltransferase [Permianibacter aggregans]QGX39419.1 methyltransferase domain-containing protein [Permianibacter aggregans]TDQ49845.1 16S rRNA (cytosine967-C5)-methyltransferase [Permianibacter aggregans]
MSAVRFARTRFRQASELLALVLPGQYPADSVIERYFKAHREMGSQDRGFAAETVYGCLRRLGEIRATIQPLIDDMNEERQAPYITAAYLVMAQGWQTKSFADTEFNREAETLVKQIRQFDKTRLSEAERCNLSDTVYQALSTTFTSDDIQRLAQALNQPAPVDLRVNTAKTDRERLQRELGAQGFDCEPTRLSVWGLRRAQRGPLFNTPAFKQGQFELQDEASQLVSWLLAPKPRETIVDFCAGAGGKSLHLSQLMRNRGKVIACDISARRLEQMSPRLRRAGCDNVQLQPLADEHDPILGNWREQADAVLVDAPCSGTGTYRRNPDLKWRSLDLPALNALQASILQSAGRLLKPGGRLVYATCSVLSQENEAIVDQFLADHPQFERVGVDRQYEDSEAILASLQTIDASAAEALRTQGTLRLYPHLHQTDGFFAQRLQRKASA